jgi:hypothetical protein
MENNPRIPQPLERTLCTIVFEGFPNQLDPPDLGTSFEAWKKLAVLLEAQFPDPYRLVRGIANAGAPPPITFFWRLHVLKNGCIHAHVERCIDVRTPDPWILRDDRPDYDWTLATQAAPKSPVVIDEERVRYLHARADSPESIDGIAHDLARQLRLSIDPPAYTPHAVG